LHNELLAFQAVTVIRMQHPTLHKFILTHWLIETRKLQTVRWRSRFDSIKCPREQQSGRFSCWKTIFYSRLVL